MPADAGPLHVTPHFCTRAGRKLAPVHLPKSARRCMPRLARVIRGCLACFLRWVCDYLACLRVWGIVRCAGGLAWTGYLRSEAWPGRPSVPDGYPVSMRADRVLVRDSWHLPTGCIACLSRVREGDRRAWEQCLASRLSRPSCNRPLCGSRVMWQPG